MGVVGVELYAISTNKYLPSQLLPIDHFSRKEDSGEVIPWCHGSFLSRQLPRYFLWRLDPSISAIDPQ